MKGAHLAIVGCGDLGQRVAARLADASWRISGLRRDPAALPPGIDGVAVDYGEPASLGALAALAPDYLLLTLKPLGRDAEAYRAGFQEATAAVLRGLGSHRPRGILMVSSTRVYAEDAGGWVDEDSPLNCDDPAAEAIIRAECQLLEEAGVPVCIVRSAGLYGGDSPYLLRRVAAGEFSPATPLRYTNRIHRDDLAGLLVHLLHQGEAGEAWPPLMNAVDDAPVSRQAVEQWLAQALAPAAASSGAADSRASSASESTGESAPEAVMAAKGKRIRNRVLHACGYPLRYPDFRSGYRVALAPGNRAG